MDKREAKLRTAGAGPEPQGSRFDIEARRLLLRIARDAIEAAVRGLPPPRLPEPLPDVLRAPLGAFVTLETAGTGRLRGCIGQMGAPPGETLASVVQHAARSAALADPRFPPVQPEELDGLRVEVTVLGPMRPIDGPEQVRIGRDGLLVAHGGRRGVLLPQVATRYGWDAETFLEQTALKAGLPPEAWRWPGTERYAFEGWKIREAERGAAGESART